MKLTSLESTFLAAPSHSVAKPQSVHHHPKDFYSTKPCMSFTSEILESDHLIPIPCRCGN
jgi:hypothetical protein